MNKKLTDEEAYELSTDHEKWAIRTFRQLQKDAQASSDDMNKDERDLAIQVVRIIVDRNKRLGLID